MSAQAAALQARLSTLGVVAKVVGAALRLSPASKVPPDLLAEVRSHKAALIALLTAPVVAVAVAPRSSLGLIPADPGYLAHHPVQAVPAPSPAQPMAHWPAGSWRKRRYASDTPGDLWTTLQRPVSWADPASRPTQGDWCGCCEGARWWRDIRQQDGGWRCSTCHPPDGLAASDIEEVRT